jgi:hypothetical protein
MDFVATGRKIFGARRALARNTRSRCAINPDLGVSAQFRRYLANLGRSTADYERPIMPMSG